MKNKKGFTLVEVVIVIAIIAILSGVIIPTSSQVFENARVSAATQGAKNTIKAYFHKISTYDYNDAVDSLGDLVGYVVIVENGSGKVDYKFTIEEDGIISDAVKVNHDTTKDPVEIDGETLTELDLIRESTSDFLDSDGLISGCYIYYGSNCKRPLHANDYVGQD